MIEYLGKEPLERAPDRVGVGHLPETRHGAMAGAGSTHAFEKKYRGSVDQGELDPGLEAYDDPSPGFFLYVSARHMAPRLRALVDTDGQISKRRC